MDTFVAFSTAFFVVALAEIGDKTQIMAIVLASRYKRVPVLLGLMLALSLLSLVAVLGGAVIFKYVPVKYVRMLAAVAFISFAVWTFLEIYSNENEDDSVGKKRKSRSNSRIFVYVFSMIFIAEFGDKTQLATIILSSTLYEPVFIFLGAVTAFFVVDAPCIYIGKKIAEKVKIKYIKISSGILFLVLGIYFILEILGYIS